MKKFVIFVFLLALVLAISGTIFANGFNLNGVGAKAIGMGGAFIGMADDFSAVYWNPAGLTQLDRPTLTLFQMNLLERGKFSFTPTGTDTKTDLLFYPSGAIGFITPLSSRVTAGIVAYVPSGLGTKWNGDDLVGYPGVKSTAQWESQVAVITLSPVIAYKVAEGVSLGASLNINYGLIKLKRPAVGQYSEESDDIGINATFGLHLRPTSRLGMGITWKTPTKFTFTGDATMSGASLYRLSTEAEITRKGSWPAWIGFGLSYKFSDRFTVNADAQYSRWKVIDSIPATFDDPLWNTYFGKATHLNFDWNSKVQLRAGFEYKATENLAIRGGYYYDPTPGPISTLNILLPQMTYNTFTFGFGYTKGPFTLDLCMEYLDGGKRELAVSEAATGGMPGTSEVDIYVPNFSLTYRF